MSQPEDHPSGSSAAAEEVRSFYDCYPYPRLVDSLDKYRRLWMDQNRRRAAYHLYLSNRPSWEDRSILVAGCGTSQAAKHALCWPAAKVTGIDFSATSALRSVLPPYGAMQLMVYAQYGRAGIYMLQEFCRRVGIQATDQWIRELIAVLKVLPPGAEAVLINPDHIYKDLFVLINGKEKRWFAAINGTRSIGDIIIKAPPAAQKSTQLDQARNFFERLWWYDQSGVRCILWNGESP